MTAPGHRDPAPTPLRLVQEFVNTNDIEGKRERFSSPGGLCDWLVDHELLQPTERLDKEGLDQAIDVREALRALSAAHNDLPADTARAINVLNRAAADAQLQPRLMSAHEFTLEPQGRALPAALGRIIALVHLAIAEGTWSRLKACERDSCRWAFYDHSKNQSGRWCHSSICGTRERSRRAYQRRRAARG